MGWISKWAFRITNIVSSTMAIAALVHLIDGISGKDHPDALAISIIPVFPAHIFAVRSQPVHVPQIRIAHRAPAQKAPAPRHRVFLSELDKESCKLEELFARPVQLPIEPVKLIILAVRVVFPC
jgi:hypothetical protein